MAAKNCRGAPHCSFATGNVGVAQPWQQISLHRKPKQEWNMPARLHQEEEQMCAIARLQKHLIEADINNGFGITQSGQHFGVMLAANESVKATVQMLAHIASRTIKYGGGYSALR